MADGSFFSDPGVWVAGSGLTFFALAWRLGAFKAIGGALDSKIAKIREDLDEAAKLRAEAENILTAQLKQQRETDKLAAEIVEKAKIEAASILKAAEADAEATIVRRRKMASDRIAQAEASAVKEVQTVAANAAVLAASEVLAKSIDAKTASGLVDTAIDDVETRLNS